MNTTSKGVDAPITSPDRNTPGRGGKTKSERPRSLREAEPEALFEIRATQLSARRGRTAWRSLRAVCLRLERMIIEPFEGVEESVEPCIGLASVHICQQLGVEFQVAPNLREEIGNE